MKVLTSFALLFAFIFSGCRKDPDIPKSINPVNLTQLVNPLMGTASTFKFSHGNVYPLIGLPWGMNSWTPQTGEMGSGWIYQYDKDSIKGFRQTHQPSPWMGDYGTFSLMPVVGNLKISETERASKFSHTREIALPHYYKVHLDNYNVDVEFSPTERGAIFSCKYPESEQSYIIIDTFNKGGYIKVIEEENKVIGYTNYNSGGVPSNFANYFEIQFDHDLSGFGIWEDYDVLEGKSEIKGKHVGAYLKFKTRGDTKISFQVVSSFIDHNQAALNYKQELEGKSFIDVKVEAEDIWNAHLNRIQLEGGTEGEIKTFYTTLYRSMLFPRKFYEFDVSGGMIHYSPYDGIIHDGYMYADNGFWDTFRAVFPLYTILFPEFEAHIMQWLVNAYEQGGWLPIWPSPGYRRVMIGAHGASLFADAMVKGIQGFDMEKALEAVIKDATQPASFPAPGRDGLKEYNKLGYVPYPEYREASAKTLEYAYDDFCIMQMARVLEHDSIAEIYKEKSFNYKNVFHAQSNLMRGRKSDGNFLSDYNPLAWGGPFTEGNAWHYSWSVFHDPLGLADLMGGEDIFINMLDSVFGQPPDFEIGTYPYEIHEITEMVAGNMGQYAHGNQPIQHMIYLYNYANQPWKTQYWIREVMNRLYAPEPDGYCGDEDNGQTSAWYVFSAMGFYPVCPGVPEYVFGVPLFNTLTIKLNDDKEFKIVANKNSRYNRYVKSINLNGVSHKDAMLTHSDIINGGILEFEMTDIPQKEIRRNNSNIPFSLSRAH